MQDEKDLPENESPQLDEQATEAGEPDTPEAQLDPKEKEIADLESQVATFKEQVMRERAENDNLRKRQQRELESAHKYGSERLLKDFLPIIDSLTLGLKAAQEAAAKEEAPSEAINKFIEGNEMTLKMFRETLQKHGVEEINPEGEKFDPAVHEAVAMVPAADKEPNTIIHVAQKGYVLNGRSIRAAQVVVAKGE